MDVIEQLFGTGKELNALQMSCRGVVIFIIALILIRISGRRSFGLGTPLDNIISVLLGAILSRAVTGASAFFPVIAASCIIVVLHRSFLWFMMRKPGLRSTCEGNKILLYENGAFIDKNLDRAVVSKEDVMQGMRLSAKTEDLDKIERIYMERNGKISMVKKQSEQRQE